MTMNSMSIVSVRFLTVPGPPIDGSTHAVRYTPAVMASGAAANRRGKLRRIHEKSSAVVVPYNTRFWPIWRAMMAIQRMTDLDLAGKRVLIREDLNVPLKDGKVAAAQRLHAALPTLVLARDAGAAVMVLSHLGRPKEGV